MVFCFSLNPLLSKQVLNLLIKSFDLAFLGDLHDQVSQKTKDTGVQQSSCLGGTSVDVSDIEQLSENCFGQIVSVRVGNDEIETTGHQRVFEIGIHLWELINDIPYLMITIIFFKFNCYLPFVSNNLVQVLMKQFYEQKKSQVLSKIGTYAVERFGNSQYARTTLNSIPLSILSSFLKGTVSFLLLYRLQTSYFILNFLISTIVTSICAFVSPVFYLMAREHEKELLLLSNHVADRLMAPGGLLYLIKIRNIIVLSTSAVVILFCLIVEVTSWYIIHTIVEFLIGFWIVDQVNQFRESLFLPISINVTLTNEPVIIAHQLTNYDFVKTGRLRQVKLMPPPQDIKLPASVSSKKAKEVTKDEIVKKLDFQMKAKKATMAGATLLLMEDWEN